MMKSFQLIRKAAAVLLIRVLLVTTLLLGVVGSIAVAQNQDVVYDDEIAEQWVVNTWACPIGGSPLYDVEQSEVNHSGDYAIEVNHSCPDGWDAFVLDRRAENWSIRYYMYPNQYQEISFYFNLGESTGNLDTLRLTLDTSSPYVLLTNYIAETIDPNTWYEVNIPMAELNLEENRFFRIAFQDASSGNTHYYLDDIYLEWINDSTPPVISNVTVTDIACNSDTITWQTDEYTNCTLEYGVGGYTSSIEEEDYSKEHEIVLENLSSNTTYQFHILAEDHQVDPNTTPPNTANYFDIFTKPPATPPVISNVSATDIKANSAIVCWTTDEPANSKVYYGEHNYSSEKTDDTLTTSHRVLITGLTPETTYQYRVVSMNACEKEGEYEGDPPMNFTTTNLSTATLSVDAATEIRLFSANIRGVNLGNWAFYWNRPYPNDSPKLRELTKLIKPGVLRYAGGLWSNSVTWDRNNTQYYPAQFVDMDGDGEPETWCSRTRYDPDDDFVLDDPLRVGYDRCSGPDPIVVENAYRQGYQAEEIDALAAFADYVGADVMIEVDITTCDPDLWADMVNYTNRKHDYNFKYWELGNELDLERAEGTPDVPVGTEYVSRYKKYYEALKAVDNSVLIVGPTTAAHEEDSYFRAFTDFIDPLTLDTEIQENQMLDVLSYHHYPLWNHPGGEVTAFS